MELGCHGGIGPHPITAEYAGDANVLGSTSAAFDQVIAAFAPLVVVVTTPNPSTVKETVKLQRSHAGGFSDMAPRHDMARSGSGAARPETS